MPEFKKSNSQSGLSHARDTLTRKSGYYGQLDSIEKRLKEIFYEIAEEHKFETLAMELMPDHAHRFVSATLKWPSGKIVSIFKNIPSKIIFK